MRDIHTKQRGGSAHYSQALNTGFFKRRVHVKDIKKSHAGAQGVPFIFFSQRNIRTARILVGLVDFETYQPDRAGGHIFLFSSMHGLYIDFINCRQSYKISNLTKTFLNLTFMI